MIRDDLIKAVDILNNHKFGTKQKSAQEKMKLNAQQYMATIKKLPDDLYKTMYMLWLAEYEYSKNKTKELWSKIKQIREYVQDQINTVCFP